MRIVSRFLAILIVLITAVMAVAGYDTVRREIQLFDIDMAHDLGLAAGLLAEPIGRIWAAQGAEAAQDLVERAGRDSHRVRIRWLWLDRSPNVRPLAPLSPVERRSLLSGQSVTKRIADSEGTEHLVSYVPILVPGESPAALEVEADARVRDRYVRTTILRTAVLTLALVLVTVGVAIGTGVLWIARPLQRLVDKANRVASGDLSGPVRIRGRSELAVLAEAMNAMCERLREARAAFQDEAEARVRAVEQLRHVDRLKTVGTLAAGIAHELGTPLNVVSGQAGLIASMGLTPEQCAEAARVIRRQTQRMVRIVRQLLDFSRSRPTEKKCVDLREVVASSVELLVPLTKKAGVEIERRAPDDPVWVRASPEPLSQVFLNLVMNAVQAMPQGGRLRVHIATSRRAAPKDLEAREGLHACVLVADEGVGMSEEISARVFDPFFTTKDVGSGSGLGLSVSYGIVRDHGGWIELESQPGKGSRFTVCLPVLEEPWPEPW